MNHSDLEEAEGYKLNDRIIFRFAGKNFRGTIVSLRYDDEDKEYIATIDPDQNDAGLVGAVISLDKVGRAGGRRK